tara:strand:+ start:43 stop:612 length:570 start_codon:yes stop_codon:yes gene_type:complete
MKKVFIYLLPLFFLGCLSIPESDNEGIAELEQRIKSLEEVVSNLKADSQQTYEEEIEEIDFDKPKVNEKLSKVTGVWSNAHTVYGSVDGPTVVEINFNSEKNKTLKFTFTPKSKYDKAVDVLYNVLIKNIDNNNNTISFYLTKIGKGFKEPLRENPIWTLKQNLTFNGFTLTLNTSNGEKYELNYIREY